jgi:Polysaccharide lyase
VLLTPGFATAAVFTCITGEGGMVDYDCTRDQGNGWYSETVSDYRYKLGFKQSDRKSTMPIQVASIRTTTQEKFRGESAIQLSIRANREEKSREAAYKVDIASVKPGDAFTPAIDAPKDWFHAFSLKIDPADYRLSNAADQHLLFEQWWQGSPFHPPISLVVINETDAKRLQWSDANPNGNFALVLRDDDHDPYSPRAGEPRRFNLGPVHTGKWMQWVVHVRPDPTGKDGAVNVYRDGQERVKLERTKVGYDPRTYANKPRPAKTIPYVGCCLYRRNGDQSQTFYFDDIIFTDPPRE